MTLSAKYAKNMQKICCLCRVYILHICAKYGTQGTLLMGVAASGLAWAHIILARPEFPLDWNLAGPGARRGCRTPLGQINSDVIVAARVI